MIRFLSGLAGVVAVAGALGAPTALGQTASSSCGAAPQAIPGIIPFTDITTQLGYVQLAAPTTDTMSDYFGGTESSFCGLSCFSPSQENDFYGPFSQTFNLATIPLPFPFGFSGIYSDGGSFTPPLNVNVWSNGLLTFDPSVGFDPTAFPINSIPPDCELSGQECKPDSTGHEHCVNYTNPNSTAVSNTFGGFPFINRYGPPNALIAPWWGDLSVCPNFGQVGWLLTFDENGQPLAVIQWTNVTATKPETLNSQCEGTFGDWSSCLDANLDPYEPGGTLPQFSFQVRLHANNDVDFVYGPASNLNPTGACFQGVVGTCGYVSGIQSNLILTSNALLDYAQQAFPCDPLNGCSQTQFPSGTSVTFRDVFRSLGPDLEVVSISPPSQVAEGSTLIVPTQISNGGGTDSTAGEGQLQFYFNPGGTTPSGSPFSLQSMPKIRTCLTAPYQAQITLPPGIPQGGGYLVAEFIPGAESADQNRSYASAAVIIGPQQADVATVGPLTFTPPDVVATQSITATFQAANVGQIDTPSVAYGIYLSLHGAITPGDVEIGSGVIADLAPGGAPQSVSVPCVIPSLMVSGDYIIGVILNPAGAISEQNRANDVALGSKLLGVTSPGPVIVTTSLQDARTNAPYSVQLLAAGGDGNYHWSLNAGALPSGLALTTKTGLIEGQAAAVGTSQFQVKVIDGLNRTSTQTLELTVDPFAQPLLIETPALPAGSTSQLYDFTIAAVGGVPPYQWALLPGSGALPSGLNLLSTGTISGQPAFDGSSRFQVTVTDAAGTSVTSPVYTLTVFAAGTLAVASTVLPPAVFNQNYTETLNYAGGKGPYSWSLLDVQREPASPGDLGADLGANLPANLSWFAQEGEIQGVPQELGVFAITVQVIDSETPTATALGLVLLTVSSSAGFTFRTLTLPGASINAPYATRLITDALDPEQVSYELVDTSLKGSPSAASTLPAALTLFPNGVISGVPLESGHFSFLAEASDGQGGVATQSFAIDVAATPPLKSGGCQSAPGAPVLTGLLLLALTQARRLARRRRRR